MLVFSKCFFTRTVEYMFLTHLFILNFYSLKGKGIVSVTPSTSSGIPTEETTNSTKESLISLAKRINRLRNNKVEFLEGVPHTLSSQVKWHIFHKC